MLRLTETILSEVRFGTAKPMWAIRIAITLVLMALLSAFGGLKVWAQDAEELDARAARVVGTTNYLLQKAIPPESGAREEGALPPLTESGWKYFDEELQKSGRAVAEAKIWTLYNSREREIADKSAWLIGLKEQIEDLRPQIEALAQAEKEKTPGRQFALMQGFRDRVEQAERLLKQFWREPTELPGGPTMKAEGADRTRGKAPTTGYDSSILDQIDLYEKSLRDDRKANDARAIKQAAEKAFGSGRAGPGGISLHVPVKIDPPLDTRTIKGARIEEGRLYLLYGDQRLAFPEMPPEYLALAVRAIYLGEGTVSGKLVADEPNAIVLDTGRDRFGELVWRNTFLPTPWKGSAVGSKTEFVLGPALGVMSVPEPSTARVLYYGPIANTRLGQVLFEADLVIAKLLYGVDLVTGKPIRPIPFGNFESSLEHKARAILAKRPDKEDGKRVEEPQETKGKKNWWEGQTWFTWVPKEIVVNHTSSGLAFGPTKIRLAAWSTGGQKSSLDAYYGWLEAFATLHYDELATRFPSLDELKSVAQTVAVIRWLKRNEIDLDTSWAERYAVPPVSTPEKIRTTSVLLSTKDGKPVIEKGDATEREPQ